MPDPNPAAFEFLATRRSRPAKSLAAPGPDADQLKEFLTVASRVPDHGALVPWRFIVMGRGALSELADVIAARADALGKDPADRDKVVSVYRNSPLCVAVVHAPKSSEKIPQSEQILTGGCVCMALVNAAMAKGWGANWISGWLSYDPEIQTYLGLSKDESIAGLIHIGTETMAPPERPRPDIDAIKSWV
ncbi:MAG: nitroreductase [Pseudomonadota bacterium]